MSNKKPKYIVTAVACSDCGRDTAVDCFDKNPTEDEKEKICDSIGGMWCISVTVFKLNNDIYEVVE